MKKFKTIFLSIVSVLILSNISYAAIQMYPPYESKFHYNTIDGELGIHNEGTYHETNLDNGMINQKVFASSANGKVGVYNISDVYNTFTVPLSGYYTIEAESSVFGRYWNLSPSIIVGASKGAVKIVSSIEIDQISGNKDSEIIYETDLSLSAFLKDVSWVVVTGLIDNGNIVGIVDMLTEVVTPNEWWTHQDDSFIQSTTVYLEANKTYTWRFEVASVVASASLLTASQLSVLELQTHLRTVKITEEGGAIYKITAFSEGNGAIDPEGDVYVRHGNVKTFNATPNNGYNVSQWKKNGTVVQNGGSVYTISDIQEDSEVSVSFSIQGGSEALTETIVASSDATVLSANPSTNYGNMIILSVQEMSDDAYSLIRFGLGDIPTGSTIHDVDLQLYCNWVVDNTNQLYLVGVGSSWSEGSVTWNNKPEWDNGYTQRFNITGTGYKNIKSDALTNYVKGWIDGTKNNYGLYLMGGNVDDYFSFGSSETSTSSQRPRLTIDYTPPPPSDLVISKLSPEPKPTGNNYFVGETIDISVTVNNIGENNASSSHVGYYLGNQPTDFSYLLSTDVVDALASDEDDKVSDLYTFTESDIGENYYIICKADNSSEIEETDETNNIRVFGPFNILEPNGSLKVNLEPDEAVNNGAQWRLISGNDTSWKDSEMTLNNIPIGTHTLKFKEVSDYVTPIDQTVEIIAGVIKNTSSNYISKNSIDDDEDGYSENEGDCNDADANISPAGTEICGDGIDQDCNGSDLVCPSNPNDIDNDSDGYTENQGDCNDSDDRINPNGIEICGDGIDQDCNGSDLVCPPNTKWNRDLDNDGYGDSSNSIQSSLKPSGYVSNSIDCNDNDADIHPGAAEICDDGIDQNCDGTDDICYIPPNIPNNIQEIFVTGSAEAIKFKSATETTLNNCHSYVHPNPADNPASVSFPYGLFRFTIDGVIPGGRTIITITLPAGDNPTTYYKYGPTPDNPSDHWYEFMHDGETGAVINGNIITLHFLDGKRGDSDLDGTNGIIADPGGPGIYDPKYKPAETGGDGGGGGCFIGSMTH